LVVLFGDGLGGGEARKRFAQQSNDLLLFGKRVSGNSTRIICQQRRL
jgi:hypothetical protein